jgi:hypothetical protein
LAWRLFTSSELPVFSALVPTRTTAAVSTPATAIAITTPASETTALIARSGLVDGHATAFEIFAIQFCNGFLSFGIVSHFHEAKSTRSASEFILD